MERIGIISKSKKKDYLLKKNYMMALENNDFVKLVNSLKVSEEILEKNTSKLERTVEELRNCKGCKGLKYCKNPIRGYVYFPEGEENLVFSYKACKYEREKLIEEKENKAIFYETPLALRNASLKELYGDKKRVDITKYIKEFINKFNTEEELKGLYLHGSFGSGKSYILSALLNELSRKGYKCVNIYYPTMLKTLKESFNENFDEKFNILLNADIILFDDLGAENNTSWSRDEVLGTILQYRMDNKKSTFFTSNLSLEELEEHLRVTNINSDKVKARRIIERIKQLSEVKALISDNKRN